MSTARPFGSRPANTRVDVLLEARCGDRRQEADAPVVDADHRHTGAEESARARGASSRRRRARSRGRRRPSRRRARPARAAATARSRASASPTPARSIVTTAARSTDGIGDPAVEVGWELRLLSLDEVEDELMVSLRAGKPRVYDPARLRSEREQRLSRPRARRDGGLAGSRTTPFGVSARPASNCGLTSTSACQPGAASRERRWQREPHRDERDVARDELRRERQLGERPWR